MIHNNKYVRPRQVLGSFCIFVQGGHTGGQYRESIQGVLNYQFSGLFDKTFCRWMGELLDLLLQFFVFRDLAAREPDKARCEIAGFCSIPIAGHTRAQRGKSFFSPTELQS